MNEIKKINLYGMPVMPLLLISALIVLTTLLDLFPASITGAMAICMSFGLLFGAIGDRLPIWKDYIGGGAILAYFGAAFLVKYQILSEKSIETVTSFIGSWDFLTLFIAVLISGSIMTVSRKLLLRAITGYIPAILCGVAGAMLFGVLAGLLVGVPPARVLTMYVLPIMGGGTGAGALPMSEMFTAATGEDKSLFLSFAMPILAIGNVFAILFAALLNKLGNRVPALSGNGELVKSGNHSLKEDPEQTAESEPPTMAEIGMGFMVVFGLYAASLLFSKILLPTIFGVSIHTFAYMVFLTAICNVLKVFPRRTIMGLIKLQRFVSSQFLFIIMFSCGIAYIDLNSVIAALTPTNIFIAFCIVLGCVVGSGLCALAAGFYPIETAITAGLCMANTGGAGDIAVLGACKRMNLMSFAQISSRLGGGIMLLIASGLFHVILK